MRASAATAIDDFPGLMRDWAEWVTSLAGVGYSDATTLWRAMMASSKGEFGSREPAGLDLLETHGALRRLVAAMADLSDDDDTREPVACVQALYLWGPEQAMQLTNKTRTKFYEAIRSGEMLIRREIKRH